MSMSSLGLVLYHSLELLPDDAGCETLLADWRALQTAGLRSQLDHRGTVAPATRDRMQSPGWGQST